ncbi:hypothetical protein V6N13_013958 [Hibiscus sabdariffa]
MLKRQPRTFYLAGTEMNWAVFLKDRYDDNGNLIDKDPLVVFNEKLYKFAEMQEEEISGFREKLFGNELHYRYCLSANVIIGILISPWTRSCSSHMPLHPIC